MKPMTSLLKSLFSVGLILFISACSSWKTQPHDQTQWQIQGKLGITTPTESVSGFLVWEQAQDHYRIHVSGPLGQGSTEIEGDLKQVTLTQDGQKLTSNNPQQLIFEQLGWHFPIENLRYWIVGKPSPFSDATNIERDDEQRLSKLNQDNWHVEYYRYDGYSGMPSRLRISQGKWRFLLVIKHWSLG